MLLSEGGATATVEATWLAPVPGMLPVRFFELCACCPMLHIDL